MFERCLQNISQFPGPALLFKGGGIQRFSKGKGGCRYPAGLQNRLNVPPKYYNLRIAANWKQLEQNY